MSKPLSRDKIENDFLRQWKGLLSTICEFNPNLKLSDDIYSANTSDICIAFSVADKCFSQIRVNTMDETSKSIEYKIEVQKDAMKDAMTTAMEIAKRTSDEQGAALELELQRVKIQYESLNSQMSIEQNSKEALMERNIRQSICNELTKIHDEENRAWKLTIEHLEKTNTDLRNDKQVLSDKYEELNKKLPHMNMTAIGNIGEEFAQSVTENAFNGECDIVSVAKEAHSMDHLVTTPSGFKCRQEVKFAKPLKKDRDIDKFHRNIERAIENDEINASMLVSLKAPIPNIPSGTLIFKENMNGLKIPILYLHVQSIPVLTHGMVLLKKIQELCLLEHNARGSEPMPREVQKAHEERVIIKDIIPELLANIEEEKNSLILQLDHIQHIRDISQSRLTKLQLVEQIKDKLKENIPWIFETATIPEDLLTKAIQVWEMQRDTDGKDPTNLKAFGANKVHIERAGGIVYVKRLVRNRRKDNKRLRDEVNDDDDV